LAIQRFRSGNEPGLIFTVCEYDRDASVWHAGLRTRQNLMPQQGRAIIIGIKQY
jgi:hypothetical protein